MFNIFKKKKKDELKSLFEKGFGMSYDEALNIFGNMENMSDEEVIERLRKSKTRSGTFMGKEYTYSDVDVDNRHKEFGIADDTEKAIISEEKAKIFNNLTTEDESVQKMKSLMDKLCQKGRFSSLKDDLLKYTRDVQSCINEIQKLTDTLNDKVNDYISNNNIH